VHANDLIRYAERYLPETIQDHIKLKELYDSIGAGQKHLGIAIRNFLNYLDEFSLIDEQSLAKYRKVIKVIRSGSDDYVPDIQQVIVAYAKIAPQYKTLFGLIYYSGIRVIEGVTMLQTYEPNRLMLSDNIAKYPLSLDRYTKKVRYVYMPASFAKELKRDTSLTYFSTKHHFYDCGLSAKYLRKVQYNQLIERGVPESVADFIQGRSLHGSVGAMHYLAKAKQADRFYAKAVTKFPSLTPRDQTVK
jgi:intergrase/recombinase